jgi:D-beta-D-heptose 7-phosphate kinase/D-beta-D-heptose 1-phosphate adenosyltransferase
MARIRHERLEKILDRIAGVRLLVVGDLVLDEYVLGDVDRVSPEAPVPVVRVREEAVALGGAANVARNALALGGRAAVCSVVGDDAAGARIAGLLEDIGVDPAFLVVAPGRPTTRKTRVVARSQQVVRFDRESLEPPPPSVGRSLRVSIERALPEVSGVVVEDYGKGVLSKRIATGLMRRFREAGLPVVVDPKATLAPYRGAALMKPNLREAEALSGVVIRGPADLAAAASRLRRRIGGGDIVVTKGAGGMTLFAGDGEGVDVPTVAREVFDVQGAGDTTVAALALSLRAGARLLEAAVIANAAAGVVVGKVGTATASVGEVRELLPRAIAAAQERA